MREEKWKANATTYFDHKFMFAVFIVIFLSGATVGYWYGMYKGYKHGVAVGRHSDGKVRND